MEKEKYRRQAKRNTDVKEREKGPGRDCHRQRRLLERGLRQKSVTTVSYFFKQNNLFSEKEKRAGVL